MTLTELLTMLAVVLVVLPLACFGERRIGA